MKFFLRSLDLCEIRDLELQGCTYDIVGENGMPLPIRDGDGDNWRNIFVAFEEGSSVDMKFMLRMIHRCRFIAIDSPLSLSSKIIDDFLDDGADITLNGDVISRANSNLLFGSIIIEHFFETYLWTSGDNEKPLNCAFRNQLPGTFSKFSFQIF